MIRTGVFIGVDRTGQLQQLSDAAAGARRMYDWAVAQGMPPTTHAKLITDEGGARVDPDQIYDAIAAIVNGPGADQLLLYFAGHGVNISRNEYWLLTDAPVRTSAAVNVSGSVELARYCGIQHVVVISDACRVAPDGIQAQSVRGEEVFPNIGASDRAKPVDQFFACFLGKTAAELKDPTAAAGNYSALYTNAMLDALHGKRIEILEPSETAGDACRYVRPRALENWLEEEIPRRVKALKLEKKVNQNPDAIITSDKSWVARIEEVALRAAAAAPPPHPPPPPAAAAPPPSLPTPAGAPRAAPGAPAAAVPSAATDAGDTACPRCGTRYPRDAKFCSKDGTRLGSPSADKTAAYSIPAAAARMERAGADVKALTHQIVRSAARGDRKSLGHVLEQAQAAPQQEAQQLAGSVERIAKPFGPDHFETECGIKVRGARIVEFFAPRAQGQLLGNELVRIVGLEKPAASVLLRFEHGTGTVIPAMPGFLAALTFEDDDLVDVAYEPSANSWRWPMFKDRADEVRSLRAVAAASSRNGRFRLDKPDSRAIAQRMQYAKGIDPTLAVYAAYAYHDLGEGDRIREMANYLRNDVGVTLFDLALLGRLLVDKEVRPPDAIVPFTPMLAQGWALLRANRVRLHPALRELERTTLDSLWSLYEPAGVDMLAAALASGDVR